MKSYFRKEIDALAGYVPGEQPKMADLIKLNTNENPFPPSPRVRGILQNLDPEELRRYPDPNSDELRDVLATMYGVKRANLIIGNGSDDLLTMIFRAFASPELPVVIPTPTYSLYPVLAAMQGAECRRIELIPDTFTLPGDFAARAAGANLCLFARPNAPTGNSIPREWLRNFCAGFDGMVVIDEAYADFADDNCMDFATEFPNVLVMRTFSKSYALAGIRLGYAVGDPLVIEGLMKLKDSYNVDRIAQKIGVAALSDREYFLERCSEVKRERARLVRELSALGFTVIPSQTNFLFVSPPDRDAAAYFAKLRSEAVIVRYFPGEASTAPFVRITVGAPHENERLLTVTGRIYS